MPTASPLYPARSVSSSIGLRVCERRRVSPPCGASWSSTPASIHPRPDMKGTAYVIIWEFYVKRGNERAFEEAYGPQGAWARFFRRGEGYLGTELLRNVGQSGRYVTID